MKQRHERPAPLKAHKEPQVAGAQGQGAAAGQSPHGLKDPAARPAVPTPGSIGLVPRAAVLEQQPQSLLGSMFRALFCPETSEPDPSWPPPPSSSSPPRLSPQQQAPPSPGKQRPKSGPPWMDWPGTRITSREKKRSGPDTTSRSGMSVRGTRSRSG